MQIFVFFLKGLKLELVHELAEFFMLTERIETRLNVFTP